MSDNTSRVALYEDLLRRIAAGVRAAQLYAPDHPLVARNMAALITTLASLHQQQSSIAIGIVGGALVVADTPMHKVSATMTELIRKLKDNKVERLAFERGVAQDELVALMQNLARLGGKTEGEKDLSTAHIRVGRLKSDDDSRKDGLASVCTSMLTEGTEKLDKIAYSEALADIASNINAYAASIEVTS